MNVTMLKTAAGPDSILLRGKSYNLSKEEVDKLKTDRACVDAAKNARISRIPNTPDPETNPDHE